MHAINKSDTETISILMSFSKMFNINVFIIKLEKFSKSLISNKSCIKRFVWNSLISFNELSRSKCIRFLK